jgi:hypothetical protein
MRGDDGARADRSFLRRRRGGFMQHVRHHTQYSGLFDSFNQDEQTGDQRKYAPRDIPKDREWRLSADQKNDGSHGRACNACRQAK